MASPQPDRPRRRVRVLVADDEPAAREKLRRLLAAHADLELVGMASNGAEAAEAIASLAPDVVLLDIRMPELDGFAVVERSRRSAAPFQTVFVTAHDEYAIRAFDVRALDYLLKPFDAARLGDTLARVRERLALERRADDSTADVLALLKPPTSEAEIDDSPSGNYLDRICIRSVGRTQIVRVADVEWVEAYGNYVRLHTATDHPLARSTLRGLASRLDPKGFCRVHRSAIVNIDKVRDMRPTVSGDYVMRLDSGVRLRLSRGYRAELVRRMAQ